MPHVARSRRSRCDAEKRIDGEQIGEGDHQHRDDDDQAPDEGLADVLVGAPHVQVLRCRPDFRKCRVWQAVSMTEICAR